MGSILDFKAKGKHQSYSDLKRKHFEDDYNPMGRVQNRRNMSCFQWTSNRIIWVAASVEENTSNFNLYPI